MSPAAIFSLVKDGLIAIAIGVLIYMVYRAGEDRVHAKDIQGLQDQIKRQGDILADWRKEAFDAQEKLASDVAAINAAPALQHRWLCSQPTNSPKPAVLPGAAGQADSSDPTGGGVQPGRGTDADGARRDAILDAFKKRWEIVLAGCRAEDAQWPK